GVMGKSVQDILRTTLTGAGYSQKYLEELYRSGLTASSVLQYTGDLEPAKVKLLQKKYSDILTGAKNAGKVVPIPIGMELKPLSYKLADAQFLELRKYTALQIAAAFGVKPDQINDYTKSSYSSSESQQLDFLVNTMLYRLSIYEQEINYKLLTQEERKNGYIYKFNEKVLLRANTETQMQSLTSAVQNGIYTPNEARHQLDLPSKDGGDVLIVNGNYVPLDNVGAAYRNA
ncbi:MAG: phage portal protein, partial [Lachnospiraceae bacterium]|nr:phage portal protein [Lachnospiraceae bacterium]